MSEHSTDEPIIFKRPDNVVSLRPKAIAEFAQTETVITSRETGDLEISKDADGWRVDHVCYFGDSAANVGHGLPTRIEAIRCALAYAWNNLRSTFPGGPAA